MKLTDYTRCRRVTVAFAVTPQMAMAIRAAASRDERTVAGYLRKMVEREVTR